MDAVLEHLERKGFPDTPLWRHLESRSQAGGRPRSNPLPDEEGVVLTGNDWVMRQEHLDKIVEHFDLKVPVLVSNRQSFASSFNGGGQAAGSSALAIGVGPYESPTISLSLGEAELPVRHEIFIDPTVPGELVSGVIWHEFAHAKQAEKEIEDLGYDIVDAMLNRATLIMLKVEYRLHMETYFNRNPNYAASPKEVDARSHEHMAEEYPMVEVREPLEIKPASVDDILKDSLGFILGRGSISFDPFGSYEPPEPKESGFTFDDFLYGSQREPSSHRYADEYLWENPNPVFDWAPPRQTYEIVKDDLFGK